MLKRVLLLAVVSLLTIVIAWPTAAQQSNWSLYLYDSNAQQLLRVYLNGTTQPYNLGLPAGAYLEQSAIDFTSDGSRAVYCITVSAAGEMHANLIGKDLASGASSLNVDLGKAQGCWLRYSADYSQIAVGVVHYYVGDTSADTSVPPWQLLVLDAATGKQLYALDQSKLGTTFDPSHTIMPEVRYFANNQIVFAGLPWGSEGIPLSPAYLWQLSDGSVTPIDRWWRSGLDSLAQTGELVWTELNSSKPAAQPGGPVPQANVVKLADKSGQERVIYANSDWVLLSAKFIDAGRQLAIEQLQAADPNANPGNQATRWIALDRSGSSSELATTQGFSQLAAAPDGYVILWASDNSASPVLTLEYHTGRETTRLWQQQANDGINWTLLWTAPTATASGLQPFPTVTQ